MIMVFLIGLIVFGFVLWVSGSSKTAPRSCDQNHDDRKHKWVIRFDNGDRKGYLVCKVCGKIPGDD